MEFLFAFHYHVKFWDHGFLFLLSGNNMMHDEKKEEMDQEKIFFTKKNLRE